MDFIGYAYINISGSTTRPQVSPRHILGSCDSTIGINMGSITLSGVNIYLKYGFVYPQWC